MDVLCSATAPSSSEASKTLDIMLFIEFFISLIPLPNSPISSFRLIVFSGIFAVKSPFAYDFTVFAACINSFVTNLDNIIAIKNTANIISPTKAIIIFLTLAACFIRSEEGTETKNFHPGVLGMSS
ncbi:hypothetical protein SDC9_152503 [bioreactor metagenome]|uniref:Uncharacterized protein n=1 Tax=bioreactor metagenome TaxID=1076179 RepID=A0A645EXM8_9ZZZZ